MCQAVLNRLEPGKISIRNTSQKNVAIVKPKAKQCIGNTSSCRYCQISPCRDKITNSKKARFTYRGDVICKIERGIKNYTEVTDFVDW
jgi:hypothetical protein